MSAARAKLRVAGYQMIGAGYVAKEYIIEPSPAANLKHEAISSCSICRRWRIEHADPAPNSFYGLSQPRKLFEIFRLPQV